MYVSFGVYDMALWLAFRNAIDLVTPYEDIIMDGAPVQKTSFEPCLIDVKTINLPSQA
jgi:hypothetical protein|eukprot:COSAG06_NODE_2690_length_6444_cov_24.545154_2_plen_58_part_00